MTFYYQNRELGDDALDAIRQLSVKEQRGICADYMRAVWRFHGDQRFELDPLIREVMKHLQEAGSAGLDVSFGGLCWKNGDVHESAMEKLDGNKIAHVIGAKAGPMVRIYDDAVIVEERMGGEPLAYFVYTQRPDGGIRRQMLDPDRYGRSLDIRDSLDEGSPVGKLRDGCGWIVGTRGAAYMGPETVAKLLESEDVAVIDPWIIEANETGTGKGRGRKAPARAVPVGC